MSTTPCRVRTMAHRERAQIVSLVRKPNARQLRRTHGAAERECSCPLWCRQAFASCFLSDRFRILEKNRRRAGRDRAPGPRDVAGWSMVWRAYAYRAAHRHWACASGRRCHFVGRDRSPQSKRRCGRWSEGQGGPRRTGAGRLTWIASAVLPPRRLAVAQVADSHLLMIS